MKYYINILLIISIVSICGLLGYFVYYFHATKISGDLVQWSQFGSFLSPIVTIFNSLLLALISLMLNQFQQRSNKEMTSEMKKKEKYELRNQLFNELSQVFIELKKQIIVATKESELSIIRLSLSQAFNAYALEIVELNLQSEAESILDSLKEYLIFLGSSQKDNSDIKIEKITFYLNNEFKFTSKYRETMLKDRYSN